MKAALASSHDARGRVPVADREIEGNGGGDEGKPEQYQRKQRKPQGGGVVERPMPFEARDPALLPPGLQAGRTEVLSLQFQVAQGAEEAAAIVAGNLRLFPGVIK